MDDSHIRTNVPRTPDADGGSGRPTPPSAKRPHFSDWTATRRNLDRQLVAVTVAGESASGEGVTATHSEPAVSGALCATDLAGEEGGGMAVELCAPRLVPDPVSSLVPLESDSIVVMCAPGYPSADANSGGDDHNLTDHRLNLPPPTTLWGSTW